ncbi:hypothetical protein DdX_19635 [Ditylenchus destructor]|uniref:Uncharacterized protein n=1 Tax=Ditylenchus destructor TaxID=166010 RepID=A0AAD4QU36_9BILA|nr:hypothetical protein DdX_19635 [Ditylenchus destructor]
MTRIKLLLATSIRAIQYTGYPRLTWSIRAIPVYGPSQYTGYPSIRAIPGLPGSIRAIPVYGLSQVNLGVYGLSQYTGYPRVTWGNIRLSQYTGYPRLTCEYTGYPSIRAIPVYGLSQVNLGVYGLSQYTGYPSIRAIPVYGLSQVNLGVYGLSQAMGYPRLTCEYTGYPSIRAIPVYGLSHYTGYPRLTCEYTGYPSIRAIPVYGLSQYTGYPSIRAIPVYGLSQYTGYPRLTCEYTGYPSIRAIPVYGLSHYTGYPRLTCEYTGYPSIRAIPVYGLSHYTGYPRFTWEYTGYPRPLTWELRKQELQNPQFLNLFQKTVHAKATCNLYLVKSAVAHKHHYSLQFCAEKRQTSRREHNRDATHYKECSVNNNDSAFLCVSKVEMNNCLGTHNAALLLSPGHPEELIVRLVDQLHHLVETVVNTLSIVFNGYLLYLISYHSKFGVIFSLIGGGDTDGTAGL